MDIVITSLYSPVVLANLMWKDSDCQMVRKGSTSCVKERQTCLADGRQAYCEITRANELLGNSSTCCSLELKEM